MNTIEIIRTDKKEEEKTFKHGQMFVNSNGGGLCFLCQVMSSMACLIDMDSGNRRQDPIKVADILKVTKEELSQMSIIDNELTPVDVKITVTL